MHGMDIEDDFSEIMIRKKNEMKYLDKNNLNI